MSEGRAPLILSGELIQLVDGSHIVSKESLDGSLEGWSKGDRLLVRVTVEELEDWTRQPQVDE